MTVTFDSYAWIEYFSGSTKGSKVRELVEGSEQIFSPALSLAEIKSKYTREKKPFEERLEFIMFRSSIVGVSAEIALLVADLMQKDGLHLADAVMYATALYTNTKLLTGDKHLKGKDNVIFLE